MEKRNFNIIIIFFRRLGDTCIISNRESWIFTLRKHCKDLGSPVQRVIIQLSISKLPEFRAWDWSSCLPMAMLQMWVRMSDLWIKFPQAMTPNLVEPDFESCIPTLPCCQSRSEMPAFINRPLNPKPCRFLQMQLFSNEIEWEDLVVTNFVQMQQQPTTYIQEAHPHYSTVYPL